MSTSEIPVEISRTLMPGLFEDDDFDIEETIDRGDEFSSDELAPISAAESDTDEPAPQDDVVESEEEPIADDAAQEGETAAVEEPVEEEALAAADPDIEPDLEAAEPEPEQPKKIMIPKSRLDDEVAKRRKLEAELSEVKSAREKMESTQQADAAFNEAIAEAQKMMREANAKVLDGDLDGAAELQQQALVKMSTAKSMPADTQGADPAAMAEQIEQRIELKATLKDIYRQFPMLDANAENADAELIDRAIMYEKMYVEMGHGPATAVERAVQDAVQILRPELLAKAESKPAPVKADPAKVREQQKRQDVSKKVEMAKAQPPETPKAATSEPTLDVNGLSEDEFDALPASVQARLRGDFM